MHYRLPPNIHVAIVDDRAIVLDIRADRYSLLGPVAARQLAALDRLERGDPIAGRLLHLGLIEEGQSERARAKLPSVASSATESWPIDRSRLGLVPVAVAIASASFALRRQGLEATLAGAALRSGNHSSDASQLVPFAQAYARQRTRLPLRHICLPDSLAMHGLLARRGLAASLVIGVRLNPFGAHCWVQAGDMLLNDCCDTVSGFTPILVL